MTLQVKLVREQRNTIIKYDDKGNIIAYDDVVPYNMKTEKLDEIKSKNLWHSKPV